MFREVPTNVNLQLTSGLYDSIDRWIDTTSCEEAGMVWDNLRGNSCSGEYVVTGGSLFGIVPYALFWMRSCEREQACTANNTRGHAP
eukprot:scaffold20619_cov155-Skeletonema_dohrnii-CCMP3373.AAC.2